MTSLLAWLAAGAVAGAYATVKGRRAAYRLSVPGLVDQAAALGAGWREFTGEMADGMAAREHDLASQLHSPTLQIDHPKDPPNPMKARP